MKVAEEAATAKDKAKESAIDMPEATNGEMNDKPVKETIGTENVSSVIEPATEAPADVADEKAEHAEPTEEETEAKEATEATAAKRTTLPLNVIAAAAANKTGAMRNSSRDEEYHDDQLEEKASAAVDKAKEEKDGHVDTSLGQDVTNDENIAETQDIAKFVKSSNHLFMKIAKRVADKSVVKEKIDVRGTTVKTKDLIEMDTRNELDDNGSHNLKEVTDGDTEFMEIPLDVQGQSKQRAASDNMKVKVLSCDTLLALWEVSIEKENYAQAAKYLTSCLEKRKDKFSENMWEIAQTQYQFGVALGYHGKHFNDSVSTPNRLFNELKADTFSACHCMVPSQPTGKDSFNNVDHLLEDEKHLLVQDFPSDADGLAQAHQFLAAKYREKGLCENSYTRYDQFDPGGSFSDINPTGIRGWAEEVVRSINGAGQLGSVPQFSGGIAVGLVPNWRK